MGDPLLERLVEALRCLPGVGPKSALRMAYHLLEHEVVPTFYGHRKKGLPSNWLAMMKESMATIIPAFSAARMLSGRK